MQLDLFQNTNMAPDQLFMYYLELKQSHENLRRGLFQRLQELKNTVTDLHLKIEEMSQVKSKEAL